uniref:Secreted protein n=1 Tax=Solanum lycopersicum TaxID=4081 RepID=A0A3Q7GSV8_SOLLC
MMMRLSLRLMILLLLLPSWSSKGEHLAGSNEPIKIEGRACHNSASLTGWGLVFYGVISSSQEERKRRRKRNDHTDVGLSLFTGNKVV